MKKVKCHKCKKEHRVDDTYIVTIGDNEEYWDGKKNISPMTIGCPKDILLCSKCHKTIMEALK